MPEAATKADIENLVALLQQYFERVNRRFDAIHDRFNGVDGQLEIITGRLDGIIHTLSSLWSQMARIAR